MSLKVKLNSVIVQDQEAALRFYTEVLGFAVGTDLPAGAYRWLTVAAPGEPGGAELLLEPAAHPAAAAYQRALFVDGIPLTSFAVDDLGAEYERLRGLGVAFTAPPTDVGTAVVAVFDDTCGNLIQLYQAL